jgi:hypothetical protein
VSARYITGIHTMADSHCTSDPFEDTKRRTRASQEAVGRREEARMLVPMLAQAAEPATADQLTRDSAILGEQFYFFTVVLMWLSCRVHVL